MLILDFEKAYDKISWTFLHEYMRKLGFLNLWKRWTVFLYEAKTMMVVNGEKGEAFIMEKFTKDFF
jgi:hypothetical protein